MLSRGIVKIVNMKVKVASDDKIMRSSSSRGQESVELIEENREWRRME